MSSRALLVLGGTAGAYYYLQTNYPKVKLLQYQAKKAIAEHILYHVELNQKQLLEQENPDANSENQENKKNQKHVKEEYVRRLDDLCDDIRSIILDRTSAEKFQMNLASWEQKAKNSQNYISNNLSNSNDKNQYDDEDDLCAYCGSSIHMATDSPPQKIVYALGKKWHQNHFICCFCNKPITSKFIQNEDLEEVFCAEHKDSVTMCYYCHHVIPFKQGNHRMSNINHGFAQPPNSSIHVCSTCESHAVNDIDTIEMLWTHLIQFFHLPREFTTIPLEMTSIESMKRYGINQPHFLAKTVTMTIDDPRPQPPPQNNNNNNNTTTNNNNSNNESNSQHTPRQNNTANILNMFHFSNAYDDSAPRRAVEKVLVMQGLPMLLCLSVLAHELGHVLICTKNLLDFKKRSAFMDGQNSYSSTNAEGYPEDDLWEDENHRVIEEGVCELISYIYLLSLEKIMLYGTGEPNTHTNSNNNNNSPDGNNVGTINNYVRNNRFLKMILSEIDLRSLHDLRRHMEYNQSHIYGTGFRNALKSVVIHQYSFSSLLQYLSTHADFPFFGFGQLVMLMQEPTSPPGSRALQTVQLRAIVNNWVLDGMLVSFQAASLAAEMLRKTIDQLHILYFHTKQMVKHIMKPNPEHRRLMVTAIFHHTIAPEHVPRKVVRSVFINVRNTTFTQLVREIYDRFRDLLPEHYSTLRGRQLAITWQGTPVLTDSDVAELTDNAYLFAEFE